MKKQFTISCPILDDEGFKTAYGPIWFDVDPLLFTGLNVQQHYEYFLGLPTWLVYREIIWT